MTYMVIGKVLSTICPPVLAPNNAHPLMTSSLCNAHHTLRNIVGVCRCYWQPDPRPRTTRDDHPLCGRCGWSNVAQRYSWGAPDNPIGGYHDNC